MKLDPGMHIDLHLVFFGKTGVTFYRYAFHMSSMRGKDTLHSNGGCPRLDAVHAAA
jgi:hypothetical protein